MRILDKDGNPKEKEVVITEEITIEEKVIENKLSSEIIDLIEKQITEYNNNIVLLSYYNISFAYEGYPDFTGIISYFACRNSKLRDSLYKFLLGNDIKLTNIKVDCQIDKNLCNCDLISELKNKNISDLESLEKIGDKVLKMYGLTKFEDIRRIISDAVEDCSKLKKMSGIMTTDMLRTDKIRLLNDIIFNNKHGEGTVFN